MTNKCTLLIDGNWLLISRASTHMRDFQKEFSEAQLNKAKESLKNHIGASIRMTVNNFAGVVDNIIIVTDGGSWRKTFKRPDDVEINYKGNRKLTTEVSWNHIWKALDEVCEDYAKHGVKTYNMRKAEGDDWIWYWSNYLNDNGISCIIWSVDVDLQQLVCNRNGVFTAWWNSKKPLIFNEDCGMTQPEEDLFGFFMENVSASRNPVIDSLSRKFETEFINPDNIIMEKIICGDASDNIKSVLIKQHKGRSMRITEKKWNIIRKKLNINTFDEFKKRKEDIAMAIIENDLHLYDHVMKMIDYNIVLVWLDKSNIPDKLQEVMNQSEYVLCDFEHVANNHVITNAEEIETIDGLLDNENDMTS